jgi:hypothetical protein
MPLIMSSRSTPNMTYFTAKQKSESDSGIQNTVSKVQESSRKTYRFCKTDHFPPNTESQHQHNCEKKVHKKTFKEFLQSQYILNSQM